MQQKKYLSILKNNKNLTSFQKRVYEAVLQIPPGKVRSYEWVAKAIGSPSSCRAVGQTLKKNPYVGIVPCHRIINKNGSLGGFAKGRSAKRKLLLAEGLDLN